MQGENSPTVVIHDYPLASEPITAFPMERYFQIHFEYLQEQLQLALSRLKALQLEVKQLELQLGANQRQSPASGVSPNQPGEVPLASSSNSKRRNSRYLASARIGEPG